MSNKATFVQANPEYDEEQIKKSTRLAQSQATENPGFVFVNCDCDQDENQKKTSRKLIRSKATAYSHRVAPRGATKHEAGLRVLKSADDGQLSRRQSQASTSTTTSSAGSSVAVKSSSSSSSVASTERQTLKRERESPEPFQAVEVEGLVRANMRRKRASLAIKREASPTSSDRALSPGAFETVLPDLTFMDASMRDPFLTYPVKYRSWYGKLISYWYSVVLPRSTRFIKASPPDLEAYTVWSRKQELSEPVLFYTSLFLASGIPVAEGLFPVRAALWLRQKTVQAMQDALADPDRATSIPVILAVGRIALHEHIYGNRELAHTMHRPAQLRMINMRGGLANLGLPTTTIQLIVWLDALMSAETDTTPYFADVPRQVGIHSYTPQEAIHVTNYSSPNRTAHPGYDGKTAALPRRSR
ncbi:hypothetical protein Slin15195_G012300 [Septoria linicola]|uniref:Uncharacterized protein n=1 Tax=Septoria linicola TaxID=215465 RepID=A0A9Q9EDM3_9PEZI|nr:hypothetical protein Slin15195_G012300 [Septoria linicola]